MQAPPQKRSALGRIVDAIFDACVNVVALFAAAVLSHPAVQDAAARTIVRGMNDFVTQPDLDSHMKVMSETMSKTQDEMAAKAGQDFPKLVGSFIQGMMSPKKDRIAHTPSGGSPVPPSLRNESKDSQASSTPPSRGDTPQTPVPPDELNMPRMEKSDQSSSRIRFRAIR